MEIKSPLRAHRLLGLASVAVLLTGCGGPGSVSLAKLAANQDAYIGKKVTTSGVVRSQRGGGQSRYYVLADRADDLVLLVPRQLAHRYTGDHVIVSGQFGVDARAGRFIRIGRIKTTG